MRSARSCAGTATDSGPLRCAPSATARRPPTPCRTPSSLPCALQVPGQSAPASPEQVPEQVL